MTAPSLAPKVIALSGFLFLLDGAGRLLRGVVGGLFLSHERATAAFLAFFALHAFVCGAGYVLFGTALLRDRPWTLRRPGWLVAATGLAWALPSLGGEYFTSVAGAVYFLGMILRQRSRPRPPAAGGGVGA